MDDFQFYRTLVCFEMEFGRDIHDQSSSIKALNKGEIPDICSGSDAISLSLFFFLHKLDKSLVFI